MTMTERGTSSDNDTKCKGVEQISSPANRFTGSWAFDAFDASAEGRRRGPYGEASRKAGCVMWRRQLCGADLGDRRLERLSDSWATT
jgi:hypothetical protein